MKTGGTLNFLRRAGAIFMLVAIFASSCNKYADDFKQLNTKIDGIAGTVNGLSALATDLATVKANVALTLAAVNALPTTAAVTKLQTDLNTANGNIISISTALTNLVTTVNNTLATKTDVTNAVTSIAQKVAADLTIQLANTKKNIDDAVAALKLDNSGQTTTINAAITANNAILEGLIKGDITANNAAIIAAITSNNSVISGLITANNAAISTAEIANIAANNAAINSAIIANNTAMAALIQAQINALQLALQGSSTDTLTSLTVTGLQMLLNQQKATLDLILANTAPIPVAFSSLAQVGGTSASVSTTALTLTFDVEPANLSAAQVTVTGATKGALTGSGTTRTLAISAITVADKDSVTVALANPSGYTITPASKKARVFVAPPVVLTGITADGVSGVLTTSVLTLTFDVEPTSLTVANLSVTGATIGTLSGTGLTRQLTISNITVKNGENVTVGIASQPAGFNITPASKTVAVNVANTAIVFANVQANGTPGAVTTTSLTLTFTGAPALGTSFTASNITLTGATKGTMTGTGNTRTLLITPTVADGQNVLVTLTNPSGVVIAPSAKTVAVNVGATPIALTGITANGTSLISTTTALTLTFSSDPTTLAASNITVTGATKGTLTGTGLTRTLNISNITVLDGQDVTVAISNPAGYTIAPSSMTVAVNKVPTGIAFSTLTADGTQGVAATTTLSLTFSGAMASLAEGNITVGGATLTAGSFAAGGAPTYTVAVTAPTANATVTVTDPTGFAISPSSKTVVLNKVMSLAIAGVTAPVTGAAPVTATSAGTGYAAGTVTWSPAVVGGVFVASTIYTATVTLTPASGFNFTGLAANAWTVAGGTATSPVNSGVVTVVFPATL